jgi:hypothetical protein
MDCPRTLGGRHELSFDRDSLFWRAAKQTSARRLARPMMITISARESHDRHNFPLSFSGNAGVVLFDINVCFAVHAEHTPGRNSLISGSVFYSGVYLAISRAPDLLSRVNKISPARAMQAGAPACGGAS